jgi:HflC protein
MFTVDQRQFAIIFQLGEIKEVVSEPGLNFKWPLIQNVRIFDKRILTLDSPEPERFLTAEKKPVLVDSFVKWRIHDVKQYYMSVAVTRPWPKRAWRRPSMRDCAKSSAGARCMTWFPARATTSWSW